MERDQNHPERAKYGCVDCGSDNHHAGHALCQIGATRCGYPVGPTVPGPCGLGLPCPAHGWLGVWTQDTDR